MADNMRWRYGDTNPVIAPVNSDTVIEIGDQLFLDKDNALPFAAAQDKLSMDAFLGIAMQRSVAGHTDPIRVATTGVFEMDCESDMYELGQLVGPTANQSVAASRVSAAMGRVAKRLPSPGTRVLVDIRSRVMGIPV